MITHNVLELVVGFTGIGLCLGVLAGIRIGEAADQIRRDVDEVNQRRQFEKAMGRPPVEPSKPTSLIGYWR